MKSSHSRIDRLDSEEAFSNTRSPLLITRATFGDILGVVRSDDFLTSFSMIHHRFMVWEETVETVVEEGGGNEGVHVSDSEPVLC